MGKQLFQSELVTLCQGGAAPVTLTVTSGPTKSKFPDKKDYFKVEMNGAGRYLEPETPQISADLAAHVGRMIVATFSGDREQALMVIRCQQGAAQPPAQPQAQPPPQQNQQDVPLQAHQHQSYSNQEYQQAKLDPATMRPYVQQQPPPQQPPQSFDQQTAEPLSSSDPQQAAIILQQGMNLYWKIFARIQIDAKKMDSLGFSLTTEELKCAVATMFIFSTRHQREGLPYLHSVAEAMPRRPVWPDPIAQ